MNKYYKSQNGLWPGYCVADFTRKTLKYVDSSGLNNGNLGWEYYLSHNKFWTEITYNEARNLVTKKSNYKIAVKPAITVLFPKPQKFKMTYRKQNGQEGEYEISQPISLSNEQVTCYCYTRKALRTFKRNGILTIQEF